MQWRKQIGLLIAEKAAELSESWIDLSPWILIAEKAEELSEAWIDPSPWEEAAGLPDDDRVTMQLQSGGGAVGADLAIEGRALHLFEPLAVS